MVLNEGCWLILTTGLNLRTPSASGPPTRYADDGHYSAHEPAPASVLHLPAKTIPRSNTRPDVGR